MRIAALLLLLAARSLCAQPAAALPEPVQQWLHQLQTAPTPELALQAVPAVVQANPPLEQVLELLASGPAYPAVDSGLRLLERTDASGRSYPYWVEIPADYDPSRKYPAVVYLHGGVGQNSAAETSNRWRTTSQKLFAEEISIYPQGWADAMWWQQAQVENLQALLFESRGRLNLDENRTYLVGVSDGASGAWLQASANPGLWASMFAINSHPGVPANPANNPDQPLYPENLTGFPVLAINGGQDRLYPAESIKPLMDYFTAVGTDLTWINRPEAGHNTAWWPEMESQIRDFAEGQTRPDARSLITFRSGTETPENRIDWVAITALRPGNFELLDSANPKVGSSNQRLYPRPEPSGRILVQKQPA